MYNHRSSRVLWGQLSFHTGISHLRAVPEQDRLALATPRGDDTAADRLETDRARLTSLESQVRLHPCTSPAGHRLLGYGSLKTRYDNPYL